MILAVKYNKKLLDFLKIFNASKEKIMKAKKNRLSFVPCIVAPVDEIIKRNPSISIEQAENLVIQRQLDLQSSKLLRDIMNEATIEYR